MSQKAKTDWRGWYELGIGAAQEDDFSSAHENFGQAIRSGAQSWEPFYARAWTAVKILEEAAAGASEHNPGAADDDADLRPDGSWAVSQDEAAARRGHLLREAQDDLDRALDAFGAGPDPAAPRRPRPAPHHHH